MDFAEPIANNPDSSNDSSHKRAKRLRIVFTAISFLLITVAIIAIYSAPMKGYELSVYGSTPAIFWIAMILGLGNGIFMFISNFGKSKRLWSIGLFEIIFCNLLLISLYVYRGSFYLERTDSLTYVGYANDIALHGNIIQSNIYPMISILMGSLSSVTGLSIIDVSQMLPAVFLSLYTISILCWALAISKKTMFVSFMMLASIPILFAWFVPTLMHETLCVLLLPLLFYAFWKGKPYDVRFKFVAGVLIVFIILGHPMVAFGVLLFLGVILLTEFLVKSKVRTISSSMVLFTFVILFGWIAFQASMVHDLRTIIEQIFGMVSGTSTFGNAQSMASKLGIWSTIQSLLVCTIDDIIYIALVLWVGIIIWRNKMGKSTFTVILACFLGGSVFLAALIFLTYAHNPFRLINLNFVMIFAIPLIGFLLCLKKSHGRTKTFRVVAILVLVCLVASVFAVYQDPIQNFPNGSVTHSEVVGCNWFIDNRETQRDILEIQTAPWRFADLIYGASYRYENPSLQDNEKQVSDHFGSFLTLNETTGPSDLVFSNFDEDAYTQVWQSVDRFNVNDFQNLSNSDVANRVYVNGVFSCYSQ
jgi:hypothetical protein